jgi:hypothetical protein
MPEMKELASNTDPQSQPDEPLPPRGHPVLAWLIIVVIALGMFEWPTANPVQPRKLAFMQQRLGSLLAEISASKASALTVPLVSAMFLISLIGIPIFLRTVFRRHLRGLVSTSPGHRIYAEAFALWIVLFFGFDGAVEWGIFPLNRLFLKGVFSLLSLVALIWPVLRGLPWQQVRQDIGLTSGRTPALEAILGGACYVMIFSFFLVVAVVVLLELKVLFDATWSDFKAAKMLVVHPIVMAFLAPDGGCACKFCWQPALRHRLSKGLCSKASSMPISAVPRDDSVRP